MRVAHHCVAAVLIAGCGDGADGGGAGDYYMAATIDPQPVNVTDGSFHAPIGP